MNFKNHQDRIVPAVMSPCLRGEVFLLIKANIPYKKPSEHTAPTTEHRQHFAVPRPSICDPCSDICALGAVHRLLERAAADGDELDTREAVLILAWRLARLARRRRLRAHALGAHAVWIDAVHRLQILHDRLGAFEGELLVFRLVAAGAGMPTDDDAVV